jgi:hypothetical protein
LLKQFSKNGSANSEFQLKSTMTGGKEFVNKLSAEMMELMNVAYTRTSPAHPHTVVQNANFPEKIVKIKYFSIPLKIRKLHKLTSKMIIPRVLVNSDKKLDFILPIVHLPTPNKFNYPSHFNSTQYFLPTHFFLSGYLWKN